MIFSYLPKWKRHISTGKYICVLSYDIQIHRGISIFCRAAEKQQGKSLAAQGAKEAPWFGQSLLKSPGSALQPLQGLLHDTNHQQTWGWHLLNQILWPLSERLTRGPLCCKTSVPATKKGTTDFGRNAPRTTRCCSSGDRANIPYGSAHRSLSRISMDTFMTTLAALEDGCWGWLNKTSYLMPVISLKAQGIKNCN